VVLADNLQLFFAKKKQVQNQEAVLSHAQETYSDAMFDYKGILYEVTTKDDEEDLPVPLSNYLKDSESLKAAYTKRNKAAEEVEASKIVLAEQMSFISILAPCCRLIFTLCSIVMHALVFERSQQDERSSEEERAARDFLCSFDWNKVLSFGIFAGVRRRRLQLVQRLGRVLRKAPTKTWPVVCIPVNIGTIEDPRLQGNERLPFSPLGIVLENASEVAIVDAQDEHEIRRIFARYDGTPVMTRGDGTQSW
jgi:hypothetical protein